MKNNNYPNFKQSVTLILLYFVPPGLLLFLTLTLPQIFGLKISDIYVTICTISAATIGLIPVILYINKRSSIQFNWTIKSPSLKMVFLLTILAAAIVIVSNPLTNVKEFVNKLNDNNLRILVFKFTDFDLNQILLLLGTVLLAPIFEEIVFRKQLIEVLLKNYEPFAAIVISALLFAFVHLRINDIVTLFLWGLIFGIVYIKSKAIEYSILLHSFSNLSTFITEQKYIEVSGFLILKYILTLLISILIIFLILRYFKCMNYKTNYSDIKSV